ncbi:MAG TPA: hypothetical protein VK008_00335 [Sphingobacteriaceae bacterium]|nr:hypothetical protein [Sphingobacteriaceae bacterium]
MMAVADPGRGRRTRRGLGRATHPLQAAAAVFLALLLLLPPAAVARMQDDPPPAGEGAPGGNLAVANEFLIVTYDRVGAVDVLNLVTVAAGSEGAAQVVLPLAEEGVLLSAEVAGPEGTAGAGEFSQEDGGLLVHNEPLPGGAQRTYRLQYRLLAPRLPVTLVRPIVYPTRQLAVMTEDDVLEPWLDGFTDEGISSLAGRPLRTFVGTDLAPVEEWRVGLVPVNPEPAPDLPVYTPRQGLTGFFWAALAAMAAAAIGALAGRPKARPREEEP